MEKMRLREALWATEGQRMLLVVVSVLVQTVTTGERLNLCSRLSNTVMVLFREVH